MPWLRDNSNHGRAKRVRGAGVCRGRLLRRIVAAVCCGLAAAWASTPGAGQEATPSQREYNVKAVTLYAFGRYVTWPEDAFASAASPLVIGVFGGNPFGDALERIAAKKTLNGRPLAVKQLKEPGEVAACHMVFVVHSVQPEVESQLIQQAAGKPVLLIGESPGFVQRGGIVNFYVSGANVKFELNPDRGADARLALDAKLLSLGTKAQVK